MKSKVIYEYGEYFNTEVVQTAFDGIRCGYPYVLGRWYDFYCTRETTVIILNKHKYSDYSYALFYQEEIDGVKYAGYYWIVPKTNLNIRPTISKITAL